MPKKQRHARRPGLFRQLHAEMARDKKVFTVYLILRLFVLIGIVFTVLRGNYEGTFFCVLTLLLFLVPSFLERQLHIQLPTVLEIIILLFIFAAEILGELQGYYIHVKHWDTMLHTTNGFLCAAIGFALVDLLNRNKQVRMELSPLYMAVVAFCFSMTIGVLWEFFEYGCDKFFLTDMQKDTILHTISSVELNPDKVNSAVVIRGITDVAVNGESLGLGGYLDIGLNDTMKDLLVNFIGAVVFSVIGFFYVRRRGEGGGFAANFIPVVEDAASAEAAEEETASGVK